MAHAPLDLKCRPDFPRAADGYPFFISPVRFPVIIPYMAHRAVILLNFPSISPTNEFLSLFDGTYIL